MLVLAGIFRKHQNIVDIRGTKFFQIRKKHEINILLKNAQVVAKSKRQHFIFILAESDAEYR
jgi:hypothetical protein